MCAFGERGRLRFTGRNFLPQRWLFAGSDRGGQRAAAMYSIIVTAKMNDVDPQLWLADVLTRLAEHPAHWLHELLAISWPKVSLRPLQS